MIDATKSLTVKFSEMCKLIKESNVIHILSVVIGAQYILTPVPSNRWAYKRIADMRNEQIKQNEPLPFELSTK